VKMPVPDQEWAINQVLLGKKLVGTFVVDPFSALSGLTAPKVRYLFFVRYLRPLSTIIVLPGEKVKPTTL